MNQDTLGSRKKCEQRARYLLERGERVIVDRWVSCKLVGCTQTGFAHVGAVGNLNRLVAWPTAVSCTDPKRYYLLFNLQLYIGGCERRANQVSLLGNFKVGDWKKQSPLAEILLPCDYVRQPFVAVRGRCNFDQSQRVKWTNLAASASLHKDVCMAVWLDFPTGEQASDLLPSLPRICVRATKISIESASCLFNCPMVNDQAHSPALPFSHNSSRCPLVNSRSPPHTHFPAEYV